MAKNLLHVLTQDIAEINPALEALESRSVRYDQGKQKIDLATLTSNTIGISEIAGELTSEEKYYALKRYNLDRLGNLPVTAFFMLELLQKIEEDDAIELIEILQEAIPRHDHDLNFPWRSLRSL